MKRGLFRPTKDEKLGEIVMVDTPENARKSVRKLLAEFRRAGTRARKRKIKQATLCATNRAKVMSENPNVSPEQRREAKRVERIYRRALRRMRM